MAGKGIWKVWRVAGLFIRELVGWAFVLISLNIFRICFLYLNRAFVIEGAVAAIVGVMLFRGGLQLVKVAVAARAVRQSIPTESSTRDAMPASSIN
jgi:hypothetical protein